MGYTVPGQKSEGDNAQDSDIRWLARRKVDYTNKHVLQFKFEQGLFIPQDVAVSDFEIANQIEKAKAVVVAGIAKLRDAGIIASDIPQSGGYLPKQLVEKGWSGGFKKSDLVKAMNSLSARDRFGGMRRQVEALTAIGRRGW